MQNNNTFPGGVDIEAVKAAVLFAAREASAIGGTRGRALHYALRTAHQLLLAADGLHNDAIGGYVGEKARHAQQAFDRLTDELVELSEIDPPA